VFRDGGKHAKGLTPQLQFDSIFRQFLGAQVHLEDVEAKDARPLKRILHDYLLRARIKPSSKLRVKRDLRTQLLGMNIGSQKEQLGIEI
jgi:hypothetical protein